MRFLTTLPDKVTISYGEHVLEAIREMFEVIHGRATMDPAHFQLALEDAREKVILKVCSVPARREAQNIAERFKKNAKAYFEFVSTPGVETNNNLAERAIRFVVIDRKVTQGTRGKKGCRWSERIWTTMATRAQQSRSAFGFLIQNLICRQ